MYDLEPLEERPRSLEQQLAEARRAHDEVAVVDLSQRREPCRHRQVVRRERRAVANGVLEREELARAAEARLHFVERKERPVSPAQLLRLLEVTGGRKVDAVALDRL